MYIGSTGPSGLHHLVYEIVDNSIDEALAGFCTEINVTLHLDKSVTVVDNGRGIPVDMHESGRPAAEVVLTVLHAGGKFDNNSYKVSGGLHGVGPRWSTRCPSGWSWRSGATIRSTSRPTSAGRPQADLARHRHDEAARHEDHRSSRTHEIFETTDFSFDTLAQRLRELAFLNAGLVITLDDERDAKAHRFLYEGGIVSFVEHLNKNKGLVNEKAIYMRGRARRHRRRDRAAMERRLQPAGVLVRQQHQHARRRHPPFGVPCRAHPDHQRLRGAQQPDQGSEGRHHLAATTSARG